MAAAGFRFPRKALPHLTSRALRAISSRNSCRTLSMRLEMRQVRCRSIIAMRGSNFHVECRDSGNGIHDLTAMRVVYLTFKTDSHLKRGRFGRGFKEILSVARSAAVT